MACASDASSVSMDDVVAEIESCHSKAISFHADAISSEENGDMSSALERYLLALRYCEEGLRCNVFDLEERGRDWSDSREMQERLVVMQGDVKQKIYDLQQRPCNIDAGVGLPPPYSVNDPINQVTRPSAPLFHEMEADTLLVINHGVQIYFVSSDDQVGMPPPGYPTSLFVIRLNESSRTPGDPEAIVQVGEKVYPLARNQMPVYKSVNGVYTFPNCNKDGIVGGSFGVVIPHSIPRGIVKKFENLLQRYGVFRSEDSDDSFVDLSEFIGTCSHDDDYVPPNMSDRLTSSIIRNTKLFKEKLQYGTRCITNAVETKTEEMTSQVIPCKSGISLNPAIKKGLEYTNAAAKTTVMIKNWLVDRLRQITIAVSQQLGIYIAQAVGSTSDATKSSINNACKVFNAGLSSFGRIWLELENSASKITKAVTAATVKNVEYKYGHDAGEATNLALGVFVSIGETAFTLDNIGAKVIADVGASYSDLDGRPLEPMVFDESHFDSGQKELDEQSNEAASVADQPTTQE